MVSNRISGVDIYKVVFILMRHMHIISLDNLLLLLSLTPHRRAVS